MGFRGFPEGNPSPRYLWPRVRVLRAWEVRVAICRACAPPSLDVARAASSQKLGLLRAADPGEPAPEVRQRGQEEQPPPLNERAVLGARNVLFYGFPVFQTAPAVRLATVGVLQKGKARQKEAE